MGKVLVIRGGALGDFILTLPAIRLLCEGLPAAETHVLGYAPMLQLAELAKLAVATRRIEHTPLAGFFIPGAKLDPEWMDYFASFDVIVSYLHDPQKIFRANLMRAGVQEKQLYPAIHKVEDNPAQGHAVEQLARPLESLALYLDHPAPELGIPRSDPKGIAIHPGSGAPRKNWPQVKWLELIPRIAEKLRTGESIALISGEAEEDWIDEFVTTLTPMNLPLVHWRNLPLETLARNMAETRGYIGHDTGVSHLAAATGTQVIALFGETNPEIWAPVGRNVTVIRAADNALDSITVDKVFDKVCPVLR